MMVRSVPVAARERGDGSRFLRQLVSRSPGICPGDASPPGEMPRGDGADFPVRGRRGNPEPLGPQGPKMAAALETTPPDASGASLADFFSRAKP